MKHENSELGVKFTTPDAPTVRQQLRFWSVAMSSMERAGMYERYWQAAQDLIEDWDCKLVALDSNLDEVTEPQAAQVIMWTGLEVFKSISDLEEVPKNSSAGRS